jgi:hypothetical protein
MKSYKEVEKSVEELLKDIYEQQEKKFKRYEVEEGSFGAYMSQDSEGDYILYDDFKELINDVLYLKEEIDKLKEILKKHNIK